MIEHLQGMNEIAMYVATMFFYSLAILVGSAFGIRIADIDQNLPYIKHRSFLTHGPLMALFVLNEPFDSPVTSHFFVGFFVAYAIHLNFDMWPEQWHGIAKIHIINKWRLGALLSFAWLAVGVVASLLVSAYAVIGLDSWFGLWVVPTLAIYLFVQKIGKERVVMPALSLILLGAATYFWLASLAVILAGIQTQFG